MILCHNVKGVHNSTFFLMSNYVDVCGLLIGQHFFMVTDTVPPVSLACSFQCLR